MPSQLGCSEASQPVLPCAMQCGCAHGLGERQSGTRRIFHPTVTRNMGMHGERHICVAMSFCPFHFNVERKYAESWYRCQTQGVGLVFPGF